MIERPWRTGKFVITAGLRPLEDKPVFLREPLIEKYLTNKNRARAEALEKHYPFPVGMNEDEIALTAHVLRERLKKDLPHFVLNETVPHRDEVDLIVSQIPEDFSVWKMENEKEWLALIHLSSPNHWDARIKIGKSFTESHEPIPHIESLSKAAPKMFDQIQKRGSVERFAWGVATDSRLNHHPEPPPGISEEEWKGRSFNAQKPKLFIRMERQTLFPISEKMVGFTIKTNFTDVSTLPSEDLMLISQCILGMDRPILKYKGLEQDKEAILVWLNSLIQIHQMNQGITLAPT